MRLGKLTKPLPIRDFISTTLLIVSNGLAVPSLCFALQPQVSGIATDIHHPTHIAFTFSPFHCRDRFLAQVIAVWGRHKGSLHSLYMS